MIGDIVYDGLTGSSGVAALVGTRVYPEIAPDAATLPLVVFDLRVNNEVAGSAILSPLTVNVSCLAATDTAAGALGDVVYSVMEGFNGSDSTYKVRHLHRSDHRMEWDPELSMWSHESTFDGWLIVA